MAQIILTKTLNEIKTHIAAKMRKEKENKVCGKRKRITNKMDIIDAELGSSKKWKADQFQLRSWTEEEFERLLQALETIKLGSHKSKEKIAKTIWNDDKPGTPTKDKIKQLVSRIRKWLQDKPKCSKILGF